MSLRLVASLALAFHPVAHHHHETRRCARTYTAPMAVRAIEATYRLGLPATRSQSAHIRRYIGCQRKHSNQRHLRRLWRLESSRVSPVEGPSIASWYYDAGTTGCGFHARYGIATLIGVPCGGRVRLCHGGVCVTATRDDSGPYVAGRSFDLDPATRAALRCPDLCAVEWRELR
jgi:hypothetical protein